MGDFDDVGAEDLHARDVGRLLFDVHGTHINVALQTEVSSGGGQSHTVLTGTGLSDDLLLAHVLGQQRLAHAVVELVCAGVVQVLALGVQLYPAAQCIGQTLQMRHRGGAALKFLADAAQLGNELAGLADGEVGFGDFCQRSLQLIFHIHAAVFAEVAFFVGVVIEIGIEIHIIQFHGKSSSRL